MFFKDTFSKTSKKPVLQLIESVRTEKGLSTHNYGTIQLPTTAGPVINVRKAGISEEIHAEIYKKLGMETDRLPVTQNFA
jgi:hypothetical protein